MKTHITIYFGPLWKISHSWGKTYLVKKNLVPKKKSLHTFILKFCKLPYIMILNTIFIFSICIYSYGINDMRKWYLTDHIYTFDLNNWGLMLYNYSDHSFCQILLQQNRTLLWLWLVNLKNNIFSQNI